MGLACYFWPAFLSSELRAAHLPCFKQKPALTLSAVSTAKVSAERLAEHSKAPPQGKSLGTQDTQHVCPINRKSVTTLLTSETPHLPRPVEKGHGAFGGDSTLTGKNVGGRGRWGGGGAVRVRGNTDGGGGAAASGRAMRISRLGSTRCAAARPLAIAITTVLLAAAARVVAAHCQRSSSVLIPPYITKSESLEVQQVPGIFAAHPPTVA
ncbi:hypothetical protein JZ751_012107 [Albula glossodonta]|uniref:Uncharacterized protein n=1 Tax=Albula glossodonta TaxID=121402 RepID=A0A8T2PRJ9_9TELE|nr:hypothetical protein JZ751_012107 [Albula glossodonta]